MKGPIKKKFKEKTKVKKTFNNTVNMGETSSPVLSKKRVQFAPPTVEEVIDYCNRTNAGIDPLGFWNFYDSKGWMVGKNKMKKWTSAVGTWKASNKAKQHEKKKVQSDSIRGRSLHEQLTDRSWAD